MTGKKETHTASDQDIRQPSVNSTQQDASTSSSDTAEVRDSGRIRFGAGVGGKPRK